MCQVSFMWVTVLQQQWAMWTCVILLRTTAVIVHGDSAECRDVPVLLGHVSLLSVTCHVSPPLITHRHCRPQQKLQQTVKIGTFAITFATLMSKTTFSDISTQIRSPPSFLHTEQCMDTVK